MRYILFLIAVLNVLSISAESIDRTIDVTKYGAKPDDGKDDTKALRKAVQDACRTPGTTIYMPKGVYILKDADAVNLERRVLNGDMGENPEKIIYTPYYNQ